MFGPNGPWSPAAWIDRADRIPEFIAMQRLAPAPHGASGAGVAGGHVDAVATVADARLAAMSPAPRTSDDAPYRVVEACGRPFLIAGGGGWNVRRWRTSAFLPRPSTCLWGAFRFQDLFDNGHPELRR